MALSGMGSSTAGGFKSLRIGLTIKALSSQVRQVLLPERAVISTRYWHHNWKQLNPGLIQAVMGQVMRRSITFLLALIVMVLTPAGALGTTDVDVDDLLADGASFDGQAISVVGELVGDYGFRNNGSAWSQLNGDAYVGLSKPQAVLGLKGH